MILIYTYIGFIGASIASFLGVIIDRFPKNKSVVKGRSHCDTCQRNLSALELIPIFSFLIQKGKCKGCNSTLSLRYLMIECLGAFSFALVFHRYLLGAHAFIGFALTSLLIIIAYIDIDTMMINDRFNLSIFALGALALFLGLNTFNQTVIGALIVSLPLGVLSLTTGAMGFGDVKLMFAAGFLLGFPNIIVAFTLAIIIGGIYGTLLLLNKQANRKTALPFGPFLCIGIFVTYLYGSEILNWYLQLII